MCCSPELHTLQTEKAPEPQNKVRARYFRGMFWSYESTLQTHTSQGTVEIPCKPSHRIVSKFYFLWFCPSGEKQKQKQKHSPEHYDPDSWTSSFNPAPFTVVKGDLATQMGLSESQIMFLEHLLCARHFPKYFTFI